MDFRKALNLKILALKVAGGPHRCPVVTIRDFFTGNTDAASIGCNLFESHPGLAKFHEVFVKVEQKPEVFAVRIFIYEIQPERPDFWPFADRAFVVTKASIPEVKKWFADLLPDDVYEEQSLELIGMPSVPHGYRILTVWWD
jgi:hypothetical protein